MLDQGHQAYAATAAKSLQSCPTLCDPIDNSPPGFSVPGSLQARILEWVAISLSNASCMLSCFSCVQLCATLWTAAHKAPLCTGFSRQEYWSGLPFPSPGSHVVLTSDLTPGTRLGWISHHQCQLKAYTSVLQWLGAIFLPHETLAYLPRSSLHP